MVDRQLTVSRLCTPALTEAEMVISTNAFTFVMSTKLNQV